MGHKYVSIFTACSLGIEYLVIRTSLSCFSGKSAVALNIFSTVDWSTIIAFAVVVSTRISDSWILRRAKALYLPLSTIRVFFSVFFGFLA